MILNNVVEIAKKNEWPYSSFEEGNIYIDVIGENGAWTSYTKIIEEEYQFNFYSSLNNNIPKEKIEKILNLITRINYGLKNGNFELDIDTGEIRFKTSVAFLKDKIDKQLIEKIMYMNILYMDNYFKHIMTALYSSKNPKEILLEEPKK